jgi:hypothetical protein
MSDSLSRRDFLKKSGLAITSLSTMPYIQSNRFPAVPRLGRVTAASLSVYREPSEKSGILFQRPRDDILKIYADLISEDGPGYNPVWYRVWGGYVHSGFVQKVRNRLNPIMKTFPSSGQLMEVTVPFTQSFRIRSNREWEPRYRLYYSSMHYVSEIIEGPEGEPYYKVNFPLLTAFYYVRASHMRPVSEEEFTLIHPEVDPRDKRIEISLDFQKLLVFERENLVNEFKISTGRPNRSIDPHAIPTQTPRGNHIIRNKRPTVHMGVGDVDTLRSDGDYPGVPWVSYFEPVTGVAIHGTYWHNNYGMTMSAGCINMISEEAKWVYRWCTAGINDASIDTSFHTPVLVY